MLGKVIVSLIATGNRHHSTCSVVCQNIIPNPNRNPTPVKRVNHKASRKDPSAIFNIGHTFALGALFRF